MVNLLLQGGDIRSPTIENAFREVLRHTLLPEDINIAEVYQNKTIILKKATTGTTLPPGRTLSSSTMPGLVAVILEASRIGPGMRVLQIGTGPGYLAALIGQLVTSSGMVATMEIDKEIGKQAKQRLSALGYHNIRCVVADGCLGYQHVAPYDRIIVTASCADVPQAWITQLESEGLLILPFSLSQRASLYPMIAFEKNGDQLIGKVACSLVGVGFIPLYGSHVPFPVIYDKSISNLETATQCHLRQINYSEAEYRGISIITQLEIATIVQQNSRPIQSVDPVRIAEKAVDRWNSLGKPKVEEFVFYLFPKGRTKENCVWRFYKYDHDMFVGISA